MSLLEAHLQQTFSYCHSQPVTCVACSPDGTRVAIGGYAATVEVRDLDTGARYCTYLGHSSVVSAVAWSPNGTFIASASWDGSVQIWNAASGRCLHSYQGYLDDSPSTRVLSVAWSPDGRSIASGATDWTIRVWPTDQHTLVKTLSDHLGAVVQVAWATDNRHLLSAGQDGRVRIWDAFLARCPRGSYDAHTGSVSGVACSPKGDIAASLEEGWLHVWSLVPTISPVWSRELTKDGPDGKETSLEGGSVSFSPDGSLIASAGIGSAVSVWDASMGTPRFVLHGHTDVVVATSFLPVSEATPLLVTGSWDGTVIVWRL